jgi:hypothetical protein
VSFWRRRPSRLEIHALSLDEAVIQYEIALQRIVGMSAGLDHNCNGRCALCVADRVLRVYCSDYDPANPTPWIEAPLAAARAVLSENPKEGE